MGTEKGRMISEVFEYLQQFHRECQQLIYKSDSFVDDGWNNMNGSKIATGMSTSLYKPERWMSDAIFRCYNNKNKEDVIKGITIVFFKRDEDGIEEPIIIAGSIEYCDIEKYDHWDLWNVWFSSSEHIVSDEELNIYDIKYVKDKIKSGKVFAYPLVKIDNDEALKSLIIDRLMNI